MFITVKVNKIKEKERNDVTEHGGHTHRRDIPKPSCFETLSLRRKTLETYPNTF